MTGIPIDARVSVLVDCARCARRVARGTVLGTGLRRHDGRCAGGGPRQRPSFRRRPGSRRCADALELIAPEAPNRHSSGSARWLLTVRTECRPRNRSGYRPSPARRQVRRQGTAPATVIPAQAGIQTMRHRCQYRIRPGAAAAGWFIRVDGYSGSKRRGTLH